MGEKLGVASVQYGDLGGTVSVDGPDQDERLYALADLSRDEWFIVAYEIYGSYGSTAAYVWAVPAGEASYDAWAEQARAGRESVSATRFDFQVDDEDAAWTLLKLNKRWSIHAVYRSLAELKLDVELPD